MVLMVLVSCQLLAAADVVRTVVVEQQSLAQ